MTGDYYGKPMGIHLGECLDGDCIAPCARCESMRLLHEALPERQKATDTALAALGLS